MVVIKRSKGSRYRGSHTHGCGSMKKRRGAGNRGGRGNAGSGKRGDAKKPSNWKNTKQFGKYGFIKVNAITFNPVNIRLLEDNMSTFLAKGLAKKEGDSYSLDLAALGYNKLLGAGKATMKMNIIVYTASASAIEKVKAAGGQVTVAKSAPEAKGKE